MCIRDRLEAEGHPGQETHLGVRALDEPVGQPVLEAGVDRDAVLGDPLGQVDESGDPAAPGPGQPMVERALAVLAREREDLTQLLLEQVGPSRREPESGLWGSPPWCGRRRAKAARPDLITGLAGQPVVVAPLPDATLSVTVPPANRHPGGLDRAVDVRIPPPEVPATDAPYDLARRRVRLAGGRPGEIMPVRGLIAAINDLCHSAINEGVSHAVGMPTPKRYGVDPPAANGSTPVCCGVLFVVLQVSILVTTTQHRPHESLSLTTGAV